ncbi:ATP-binding cassette domain-containing protein [Microbacterium elymi]|uniref:ATP-binding cassette domain-containing protein n=1 Tax=Microbacterium elymi TaxID=2909587 RepID=A0ABY5NKF7_9MICO|nr:ATP-binding cassette domain-containing protein [Microbacterium elymi]UUT35658.1 ATP-binding cassette domain-containing protein [Microbacterium elymi]
MSARTPLLAASGLHRRFAGVQAVDDVSLQVDRGEVVSIIGPNGSGKTTTLNLIAGTLRPDAGQIELEGRRIDGKGPAAIADAGIARTFQNGRVFGALSVRDNVEVGLHSTLTAIRPFRRLSTVFGLALDRAGGRARRRPGADAGRAPGAGTDVGRRRRRTRPLRVAPAAAGRRLRLHPVVRQPAPHRDRPCPGACSRRSWCWTSRRPG